MASNGIDTGYKWIGLFHTNPIQNPYKIGRKMGLFGAFLMVLRANRLVTVSLLLNITTLNIARAK